MIKTNIPAIILKGNILFPSTEIRLSSTDESIKTIVEAALEYNAGHILLVPQIDNKEMSFQKDNISKLGVIGKVKMQLQISDDEIRYIIEGLSRVKILDFYNAHNNIDLLEGIIAQTEKINFDAKEEFALVRILKKEINKHINTLGTLSNSLLETIAPINSVDKITDIVTNNLYVSYERKLEYLNENNPQNRVRMILSDIKNEQEISLIEEEIEEKINEHFEETQRDYVLREKLKIIKEELNDVTIKENDIQKLEKKLAEKDITNNFKLLLKEEIKKYEFTPATSPEMNVIRNYIDTVLKIPFGTITNDRENLKEIEEILNESHFGLKKVKRRFIEQVALSHNSKKANSPIICLVGPPGIGKTTLALNVANAIGRKFAKISVAGITDEAELIGHRKAYIGASPGRFVKALIKAGSMNPVILLDEIDKMGKSQKGDPSNILLEIFDKNQNNTFSDNYIEEELDLSSTLFITTANYLQDIPHALRDRLEIINLNGYTTYDKIGICKDHIIPKICKEFNLKLNNINISDNVLKYVIINYTKEAGVRELERSIETILRQVVCEVVMLKEKNKTFNITLNNIKKYLGNPKFEKLDDKVLEIGVANALTYSVIGGGVAQLEVVSYSTSGDESKINFTGNIGKVMEESSRLAFNFLRSSLKKYKLKDDMFKCDYHLHMLDGYTPKEGPSAGITLVSVFLSHMKKIPLPKTVAFTGEISLRGKVMAIGGLCEKLTAAYDEGITKVFIPKENILDLEELPTEIKNNMKIVAVSHYDEIYNNLFE
ncbi:MAG: endopeptidase La [Bacilli bacterium]